MDLDFVKMSLVASGGMVLRKGTVGIQKSRDYDSGSLNQVVAVGWEELD